MEFLTEYGLFLAKTITFVVAVGVIIAIAVSAGMKNQGQDKGHLQVVRINERFEDLAQTLKSVVLPEDELKAERKEKKKEEKAEKKKAKTSPKDDATNPSKRVFVTDFHGDIKASATDGLREVVTSILSVARESDEVVVRLESQGGMVHSYGLAASQLKRITDNKLALTVCVDKIAASGGYMMACVAQKILCAPFAIMGSIGVVAQMPNFHRLLKKHDVDYEMVTAGEYKRTLTMFGENTDKGREKFAEDIEDTHTLFKTFIKENREGVDVEAVSTGEVWFGTRALENNLVDGIETSDQYLFGLKDDAEIFEIKYVQKKTMAEKIGINAEASFERVFNRCLQSLNTRFFS